MKIDIENFYMSPEHDILLNTCFTAFSSDTRGRLRSAADFLLVHQHVKNMVTGDCYQVIKGSGMGSVLSGDMCDEALWILGEAFWASDAETQQRHGVLGWFRYRDDILAIASDRILFRDLFNDFKNRLSKAWLANVEAVSRDSMQMLDISVYKSEPALDGTVCVCVRPFF